MADLPRPYIPAGRAYTALGTDGFGRSDTRAALRAFFEVDRDAIVTAALAALGRKGAGGGFAAALEPVGPVQGVGGPFNSTTLPSGSWT